MGNSKGQPADTLIDRLQGPSCASHDFFRLVRLIQAARPDCPPIGRSKTPQDDPVRFGQQPSLAFAPGAIDRLVPGLPPKLYVNFFGLLGPNGPLPLHITQLAARRQPVGFGRGTDGQSGVPISRASESASETPLRVREPEASRENHVLRDFLDIFHHRLLSLFFRAWADSQPALDLDGCGRERFLTFIGSLCGVSKIGVNPEDEAASDEVSTRARAFYSGRLALPTRNAEGLAAVLSDYFQIPTVIEEFTGRWFDLPAGDRLQLNASSARAVLGENTILGSRMWAVHLSFRITMGPMSFMRFQRLLPCSPGYRRLQSWMLNYVGTELLWEVRLLLEADEVPDTVLGRGGRLGWTTWLRRKHQASPEPGELVLSGARTKVKVWDSNVGGSYD